MADACDTIRAVRVVREVNRRRRTFLFKERKNPLISLAECEFQRRYRFSKETVRYIINLVKDDLKPLRDTRSTISTEMQVLITLSFFAKGLYQEDNGDLHGVSQQCVSRIVKKVSVALASHLHEFVKFYDTEKAKEEFYNIAGFPCVIGCVDCTHIKIKNPSKDKPLLYCNRKGWYSLNVQVVCDAQYRIVDLVARWRGSAHDSRIWDECGLKQKFEDGNFNVIILGDGGYPCTQYLLTPFLNPSNPAENRYNSSHIRTRCTVERCFSQWKARFRALQNGMLLSLDTVKAAIASMAILHNIKINSQHNEADSYLENSEDEVSSDEDEMPEQQIQVGATPTPRGNIFRQQFARRHFSVVPR